MGRPNLVLNPKGGESIEVGGRDPAPDLRPWIARLWTTRWDFRGQPPRVSELLTDTGVHLVVERGASRIVGPTTRRFRRRLDDDGRVVGARFATGAVHAFTDVPVVQLVDRIVALGPTLGLDDVASVEDDVLGVDEDEASFAALERFLRARRPAEVGPRLELVQRLVALVEDAPDLTTVTQLCTRAAVDRRALQRLFRTYLGLGPKHVIQRARLREAAERIKHGARESFAALAAALGYFDQAHFARDFKAATGRTPSQWARELEPR